MPERVSLSVVMPCLNEERTVADAVGGTLRVLEEDGIEGEVVIVNDGSMDRTPEIAETLARGDRRVRAVHHETPQGYGGAYWGGVRHARGDYVILIPGDNENDARECLRYFYLMRDVDILVPFVMNAEVRSHFRRFVSSVYRFIVNVTFGTNFNYTNGTVIYKRSLLEGLDMKSRGFFFQTELLVRLVRSGYMYAEVPYFLKPRVAGETKALSLRSIRDVMSGYLWLFWKVHIVRELGRFNRVTDVSSATYRRHMSPAVSGDHGRSDAYEGLLAWSRSVNVAMEDTKDPRLRVEELARSIATLRLKSLYAPSEPDPQLVRRLVREYLSSDRNREIVKGPVDDAKVGVVFEKMITHAAQEAIRASENQPFFGCKKADKTQ